MGRGRMWVFIAITKVSVDLIGSWEAGMAHQSWFKSIQRGWVFPHLNQ